jgi:hypothetical protein
VGNNAKRLPSHRWIKLALTVMRIIFLLFCLSLGGWTHGAGSPNSASPIGMNAASVSYFQSANQFANIMKNAGQWFTSTGTSGNDTGEELSLCLNADGYPTDLSHKLVGAFGSACTVTPTFNSVSFVVFLNLPSPYYPGGTYDIYYPSGCTITVGRDGGSQTTITTGHDQFTATPSGSGLLFSITALGASDCDPISVTPSNLTAAYLAQCTGGLVGQGCFNPQYCCGPSSFLYPFRALRFMEWMQTNNDAGSQTWAGRPTLNTVFWSNTLGGSTPTPQNFPAGVPVEIMVGIANLGNLDPYFNMPTTYSDADTTSFATYVHSHLNSNLRPYFEYSNEPWNYGFTQATTIQNLGQTMWGGTCGGTNIYECNGSYVGYRSATMCQDWATAWGSDFGRVTCAINVQAANSGNAQDVAACQAWSGAPCSTGYGITAFSIAPYFGCDAGTSGSPGMPYSYTPTGTAVTDLFTSVETGGNLSGGTCEPSGNVSLLAQSSSWETSYTALLPLGSITEIIEYEWGQSFTSENYSNWTTPMLDAQTDSRMATAYANRMATMESNGVHLAIHYNDIAPYTSGFYGADNTMCDPNCTSPTWAGSVKYAALLAFIAANPCTSYPDWPNCKH